MKESSYVESKGSTASLPESVFYVQSKRNSVWIIAGFFIFYAIFYLFETPIHTFIESMTTLRSEYTVGEQLSKFYLFLVLLLSFFSYRLVKKPLEVKLTIAYLLFSLIMYLSESNMIRETAQPVYAVICIFAIIYFLFRLRLWLSLILFFTAMVFLSFGSLIDFIHEREWINTLIPNFIYVLLDMAPEERFDVLGALFFTLSATLVYQAPLQHFLGKHKMKAFFVFVSAVFMTVGNGLLHYQYEPGHTLYKVAMILTVIGFLGLLLGTASLFKRSPGNTLLPDYMFYILLFFGFVLLPGSQMLAWTVVRNSFLIWFPVMIFLALVMYYTHDREISK